MRLGGPFIAPRQLGAVESNLGRLILPSVDWRTGQSGAHRTLSGARFPSINGAVDRWRPESCWRTGHVRCTPDSPVPPTSRWLGHVSRADRAADSWPDRPLAHRTVRCTPDTVRCPISFHKRRSRPLAAREPLAHRTDRCPLLAVGLATCPAQIARPTVGPVDRWLTGQSGAHRTVW
jgi:hypothetical protein